MKKREAARRKSKEKARPETQAARGERAAASGRPAPPHAPGRALSAQEKRRPAGGGMQERPETPVREKKRSSAARQKAVQKTRRGTAPVPRTGPAPQLPLQRGSTPPHSTNAAPPRQRPDKQEARRAREIRRQQRAKKRRRRGSNVLIYCMFAVILAGAGVTLSLTVFFKVTSVEAKAGAGYTAQQLVEASGLKPGVNLFLADTKGAQERIEASLPYVAKATVSRAFPDRLRITVTRAKPVYSFRVDGGYALADETLKILARSEQPGEGTQVVTADLKRSDPGHLAQWKDESVADAFEELCALLKAQGWQDITEIRIPDIVSVQLVYQNRIILDLGRMTDADKKLLHAADSIKKLDPQDEGTLDLKWWTSSNREAYLRRHAISDGASSVASEPPDHAVSSGSTASGDTSSGAVSAGSSSFSESAESDA